MTMRAGTVIMTGDFSPMQGVHDVVTGRAPWPLMRGADVKAVTAGDLRLAFEQNRLFVGAPQVYLETDGLCMRAQHHDAPLVLVDEEEETFSLSTFFGMQTLVSDPLASIMSDPLALQRRPWGRSVKFVEPFGAPRIEKVSFALSGLFFSDKLWEGGTVVKDRPEALIAPGAIFLVDPDGKFEGPYERSHYIGNRTDNPVLLYRTPLEWFIRRLT